MCQPEEAQAAIVVDLDGLVESQVEVDRCCVVNDHLDFAANLGLLLVVENNAGIRLSLLSIGKLTISPSTGSIFSSMY